MSTDARVTYWLKGQSVQNFGDALSEVLFDALTRKSLWNRRQGTLQGDFDVVHLIGSCISDWHILKDLEYARPAGGQRIAFWGCGVREKRPLSPELTAHCAFLGVRGPLSRDILGLPPTTPLGDPGLLLPYVYAPGIDPKCRDQTLCVPHFHERRTDEQLLELTGCDRVLRPNIRPGKSSILAFIDSLASAKFVLAGALHAGILAHAYSIPYAYFDSDYIDIPFKWADFAASVSMRCEFARNLEAGRDVFDRQVIKGGLPDLTQLVACSPYRPPKTILGRAAALRPPSSPTAPSGDENSEFGNLLATFADGADFSRVLTHDTVGLNSTMRRIANCVVLFDAQGRTFLRLRGGAEDASSGGATGGFAIQVPPEVARAASGRTVRVSALARVEAGMPGTQFALTYSTNEAGNSGWHWFEATPQWSAYEILYAVPEVVKGKNGAFIGLLPAIAGKAGIEIVAVAARVQ
jgi:hypothetical protein